MGPKSSLSRQVKETLQPAKTHSYRKYLEFVLLCLLASALLWFFGRNLDWVAVRRSVADSNPYLLAIAVAIISVAYLFRAYRWGALLRPIVSAKLPDLFAATTIGFGAVFLIGRTGEVVRPVVLPMRDPRVRPSASFVTIMVERLYDMIAVVVMFAVNLLWFKPTNFLGNEYEKVRLVGIVLLICAVVTVATLMWFRKNSVRVVSALDRLFKRLHFIPARLVKLIISTLEQLARALRVLVNFRELAETIGWTVLLWFGVAIANVLVIRAFGLPFGLTETIFVLGWSLVGSLVPTPGGAAGAYHAATGAGLLFLGVSKETAAAISIVMGLVDFGPAAVFGLFYFLRGDVSLSRLRALASPEAVEHSVEDEALAPDQI
ncbi:MAG TPA: lysylphosphatidylglycerol synthase transmembrane domain-containing protein [Pyrinomonadaceae bacterium]|nr:lysylphosphatidylglycerol synthase transmembrane domain-containing protein [Pyrinomonadaceae bacterium]